MAKFLRLIIPLLTLFSCREDIIVEADLYSAIPQSSPVIMETNDFAHALLELSQTRIYLDVDSMPAFLEFRDEINQLKEQFPTDSLMKFLKNRKVVMSLSMSGAEKYDVLFATTTDPDFEKLADNSLAGQYTFREKKYSEARILTFYSGDEEEFSVTSHQNILIVSSSINLVEEAVRQLNSDYNYKKEPEFEKLYRTANRKDLANIYLNLQELPNLLDLQLPRAENDLLKRMGHWAELDLQVYNREMIMSGLMLMPDEEAAYPMSFAGSEPQTTSGQHIVPSNMALWVACTFENAEEYYRNYLGYLRSSGNLNRYQHNLDEYKIDPAPSLLHWLDTEMGIFYTQTNGSGRNKVAYMKFRSRSDAAESLNVIADSSFIEGYRGEVIKQLNYANLLPAYFGRLFKGFKKPHYIVLEDFVLFCEDEATLKGVINDLLSGKNLASEESYQRFRKGIPSEAHISVVASNPLFLDLLSANLSSKDSKILERMRPGVVNYRWAGLQMKVEDQAAFLNLYLLNEPRQEEEVIRQWSTILESPAISAPQMVLNHNTQKYEVVIQDSDFRLYLIDPHGKILWTRQLDGPVMGTITQVDAYRNNKLQLVLNTARSIYLIDRLGRDVEKFPVQLPQAATAPAGIFNYDRARNYRIMVPAGNKLLNYGIDGKPVEGWEFKKADGNITHQPQLFTVDKKDVISFVTDKGTLYLLNRRGDERFKRIEGLEDVQPPFYLREGDVLKESELLAHDGSGRLVAIAFDGITDRVYLDAENPMEHLLYFDDRYIFSSGDLLVMKNDVNPWSVELNSAISRQPKAMVFRREFYVAAYSESAEEVNLYNKNGELIKGFPVYAQGNFDMGSLMQDGAINIISSSKDGTVICYRVK